MSGTQNAVRAVLSLNLRRRQLSASELAYVALEIEKVEAVIAKARRAETLKQGPVMALMPEREDLGAARDKAAAIARHAAKEVEMLFDLVGRLEVVDLKTWQAACDAHEQALLEQVLRETWTTDSDAIDQPFAGEADYSESEEVPF